MSWFFIDTHSREQSRFGWLNKDSANLFSITGRTVNLVAEMSKKIRLKDLRNADGICIVKGPGSFSSIRAGVLIANLLSRIYKLDLLPVSPGHTDSFVELIKCLENGKIKKAVYVDPIYDQEPNITLPKKV
ncbi:MAG: hypothetical protein ACOYUZ_06005 [Patescibacteria group bacterium]